MGVFDGVGDWQVFPLSLWDLGRTILISIPLDDTDIKPISKNSAIRGCEVISPPESELKQRLSVK